MPHNGVGKMKNSLIVVNKVPISDNIWLTQIIAAENRVVHACGWTFCFPTSNYVITLQCNDDDNFRFHSKTIYIKLPRLAASINGVSRKLRPSPSTFTPCLINSSTIFSLSVANKVAKNVNYFSVCE